jgi:uncharacterized protein (DUF1499 family)
MRLLRWLIALVALAVVLVIAGVLQNDVPLDQPPGRIVRLGTYLNAHVAETIEGSPFPELRPRRYALPADVLFAKVKEAVARLPRWSVVETSDDRRQLHAVVTSRLFRFRDDVTVTIVPEPGGRPTLLVRAASRVGRGDLGANTRHVLDLHRALEEVGAPGAVEDRPRPTAGAARRRPVS